jgi:lipoprotein-anchoring transpeptidase ErfK/SrfK
MRSAVLPGVTLLLIALLATHPPAPGHPPSSGSKQCTDPLSYQVLLDRAGFSPGEIDGTVGPNLKRALAAYQQTADLPATGEFDCATWAALSHGSGTDVLTDYEITDADVAGPFLDHPLPDDLAKQAELPALAYESVVEALAERFHMSPRLLTRLNRNQRFEPGQSIRVAAVTPFDPSRKPLADSSAADISIEVSRSQSTLKAVRSDGSIALFAPVSSGSEHDPLPIGTWKVNGTSWMPPFHYNPDLFWDADAGHSKATIKPGPNNPVGVVWIDINVPHYGLHGTPGPNLVGHAQSHGCVRLTNWDAARLAALVKPGTRVVFTE